MFGHRIIWSAVIIVALGSVGIWYINAGMLTPQSVRLAPSDPHVIALGETIYGDHCAVCHGINLEGQPNWRQRNEDGRLPAPPHDASGHTWHHPDAQLFDMMKHGIAAIAGGDYQTDMPIYEDVLSDDEVIAVLSYIKSTWPPEVQAQHDSLNPL